MSTTTLTRPARTPVRYPRYARQSPTCTAPRHGTYTAYRDGCRCPHARESWRLYKKRHRERRAPARIVDATGTRRRLQALAAIGWPFRALADPLGYRDPTAVARLAHPSTARVNARTAAAVTTLYDRLSMTPGPSSHTRGRAIRAGWAPPLAWDSDADLDDPGAAPDLPGADDQADADSATYDHVAVDLALAGRLPPEVRLRPPERAEALRRLDAAGVPAARAAERLRVTVRTVQRHRAHLGLSAALIA